MTRIDKKFSELRDKRRGAFIAYITAGDPSLKDSRDIVWSLAEAGADIIELGVPFSDPIADGPVIQRGTERALKQGVSLRDVLALGREIRTRSEVPLLLFSYFNPLFTYGLEKLAEDAVKSGFDGVLATDLTIEESSDYVRVMGAAGLNTVFLTAPTSSPDRLQRIAAASTGFLYAVSRTGVTGQQQELDSDLKKFLGELRCHTKTPIAVGFGISTPEHVKAVCAQADGAVVGSAIVAEIEKNIGQPDLAFRVGKFARWLSAGVVDFPSS